MNKNSWTGHYKQLIERNIGIISTDEQELIRNTHVAIFGTGGLGGRIAEILVRSGCERISIIDKDTYSISNLSTQNITQHDLNKKKVDVLKHKLQSINPNSDIREYHYVDEINIDKILENVKIASLSLDGPFGSILVARECKKRKIPMIEAWSSPYLYAWWFTEHSMDYETCYNLKSKAKSYAELKKFPNLNQHFRDCIFTLFEGFSNLPKYYNYGDNTMEKMKKAELNLRSFAPFVFLTGSFIAFEIIFSGILQRKQKTTAPEIISIDLINLNVEKFRFDTS